MRLTRSEIVGRAVRTAIRNPGRSGLTMLGLTSGVGAFIAMVSFGTGPRSSVMQQFEILGSPRLARAQLEPIEALRHE